MSCPDVDTLTQYAAGFVVDEEAVKLRAHALSCLACQAELAALGQLTRELASDDLLPASALTVDAVVASAVTAREPLAQRPLPSWAMALAAAVVVLAGATLVVSQREAGDRGTFTPRGTAARWRERVSARVVATPPGLVEPGTHVAADARFSVLAFGVSPSDALHLLAFLVDSKGEAHWITPQWLDETHVPGAERLSHDGGVFTPSMEGAVLGSDSSVVFDDLPLGPAVLLTVVREGSPSVLAVERLPSRTEAAVKASFPDAHVRAVDIVIDAAAGR